MNVIINTYGGGIYSLLNKAMSKLVPLSQNYNIKNFKIVLSDNHIIRNKHIFDDFFEYDNEEFIVMESIDEIYYRKVYDCPYYDKIKSILHINRINKKIVAEVDNYANLFSSKNTLAVHIRLTDMNIYHGDDYGIFTLNDYINKIDAMLLTHTNIDTIYIASDNIESIDKLLKIYSDKYKIHYINDAYRVQNENDDAYLYQLEKMNNPDFHVKGFIELLVASRCTYFIGRISDYSNFCLLFSNTINYVESIN